jgi:PKD repeat protein
MLVATQGSDGMKLYVDGVLVGTNSQTGQQAYQGYWRIGGDKTWSGSSSYFAGSIDEPAVYSTALTPAQITAHYNASSSVNKKPTAVIASSTSDLTLSVDGSGSSDPDGSVTSYAWDFGDGATGSGATTSHTYGSAGTYNVTLTVTDNGGATGTSTKSITVTAPNQNPTASFTSSTSGLKISVDGSGSSDPDGNVASYAWDFGDGQTGTGSTASHTYAAGGTYTVKLTVTDDRGGTDSTTSSATVTNQPPTAAFTASADQLSASFDASGSADSDGSIASYVWDFGDSTTGTGVSPQHAYAAGGTYTVTLVVTDNASATDSVSHAVTVTAPVGPVVLASDDFGRTVASGWGTADQGGAWTVSSASSFAVDGSTGKVTLSAAGSLRTATLGSVSSDDTDMQLAVSFDKPATGGGYYLSLVGRKVSGAGDYRAKMHVLSTGQVKIAITRADTTGAETIIAAETTIAGLTYTAGDSLSVRMSVTGVNSTAIKAKVWSTASTEPSAWQVSTSDSTAALQTAGSVAVVGYASGSTTNAPIVISMDGLRVYKASTVQ